MHYILILFIIISFLVLEKILHERRLNRIPIRIHINGTRGKSSVTRLIAAALRGSGIRTMAKTTGNSPMLIYPDGHEEMIKRRGPSRIQEQIKFIKKSTRMNVEAIVMECMAVDPFLQFASETNMIKSTIGVITNVRPDHHEVMGRNLDDIAESLSQSIPQDGILVTADRNFFAYFRSRAAEQNTRVYLVEDTDLDSEENPKRVLIFRENFLIAKKVCSLLGVVPSRAHGRLKNGISDKEDGGIIRIKNGKRTLYFIDAFSANDIESTKIIQQMTLDEKQYPKPFVALLNNRSDRPLRMLSFASFLSREPAYNYIMLIGDCQRMAKRYIHREGKKDNIIVLRSRNPEKLIDEIYHKVPCSEFTIVGMGNYKGIGGELSRFLRCRGER